MRASSKPIGEGLRAELEMGLGAAAKPKRALGLGGMPTGPYTLAHRSYSTC